MTEKLRSVAVVGALALSTVWTIEQAPEVAEPLTYEQRTVEGSQVLAIDEDSGRIAEVFGDLANADSIVVFVPGASWNLQNFDDQVPMSPRIAARNLVERAEHSDRPSATDVKHPSDIANSVASGLAGQIHSTWQNTGGQDFARPEPMSRPVAAVAWLGYQPPPGLGVAALRSERAEAGAEELARFVQWLPADASITLSCHSYGSVVCGKAASEAAVDNIVSIGGAGMDVAGVANLDTTANVWVAQAPADNIRFLPGFRFAGFGHGRSPVADDFDGFLLDTGAAREHADYYDPDGATITNLLRIADGRYTEVLHA